MSRTRRHFTSKFKSDLVIELLSKRLTTHRIPPDQIS